MRSLFFVRKRRHALERSVPALGGILRRQLLGRPLLHAQPMLLQILHPDGKHALDPALAEARTRGDALAAWRWAEVPPAASKRKHALRVARTHRDRSGRLCTQQRAELDSGGIVSHRHEIERAAREGGG